MMKIGREIKTNLTKNYNVIFGSVNNRDPKALYISISAWGELRDDSDINYIRVVRRLNKAIKQNLFDFFSTRKNCEFRKEMSIVDLDIRESGIRYGKRSFMNCEITLYLSDESLVIGDFINNTLTEVATHVINEVFETNEVFKFQKKKK